MSETTILADVLGPLRDRIDAIDSIMVECLAQRIAAVEAVIALKHDHGIAARLPDRVEAVVAHVRAKARAKKCPPDLAEHLWRALIEWTIAFEERQLSLFSDDKPEETSRRSTSPGQISNFGRADMSRDADR